MGINNPKYNSIQKKIVGRYFAGSFRFDLDGGHHWFPRSNHDRMNRILQVFHGIYIQILCCSVRCVALRVVVVVIWYKRFPNCVGDEDDNDNDNDDNKNNMFRRLRTIYEVRT